MLRKNQILQSLDTTLGDNCCNCQSISEPVVPPVVPIVSVRSVAGMDGDVELKKLTIGEKVYDGSESVQIVPADFGFAGMVNYRGWTTSETILKTPVEIGDLYYAQDKLEFWLAIARGDGAGVFRRFPTVDFLEPYAFFKESASEIELRFTDVEQSYTFFAVLKDKLGNEFFKSNELDLPIEQLVKEIKYDHETRSLIFVLQSGKEISVSLSELVNSLQEKITPEKKLAFDLVEGLTDFKVATDSSITTLQSDLSAEILRSKAEEAKLDAAIKAEEAARVAAITAEAEARAADDTTEKEARIKRDSELTDAITVNSTAISAEATRARAAEEQLQANIDTEASTRKTTDEAHQLLLDSHTSLINTINTKTIPAINDALATETSERKSADTGLNSRLAIIESQNLDTRLGTVEVNYPKADAEIITNYKKADAAITEDYQAKDATLQQNINKVESEYKAADAQIRTDYAAADNVVRDEFAAADNALNLRIKDLEDADFGAQIATEIRERTTADAALDARLKKFEEPDLVAKVADIDTKYQAKDVELNDAIVNLTARVATEEQTRLNADSLLEDNLNTEIRRATRAEEVLTTSVGTEKQERIAGDSTLEGKINTETSARISAVSVEEEARKAQDEILANYIKAEKDAREAADTTANARIDAIDTAYKAADAQLRTDFTAADTALGSRIDAEISRAEGKETELNAAINTEKTRAEAAESSLSAGKLDIMPGDAFTSGNPYNLPYYFRTAVDDTKITITAETVTLDGNKAHSAYSLDIPSATTSKAGLLSAADKYKIDNAVTETGLAEEITRAKAREDAIELGYQTADSALSNRIDAIHVAEYTMVKDATSEEYAAVYHLTKDGVNQGVEINIPKDQMLKDVKTGTCTTEGVPEGFHVGEHYIELIFETASGEVKRYIKVEDVIKPYTGSETITISSDNVISLNADVKATIDTTKSGLAQELVDRKAEDAALNVVIGNEKSRAIAREEDLQDQIDQLDIDIKAEETRAKAAEAEITTNLNNEIARATTAENTLTTNLNNEITRATQAEATEKQRAEQAEATLTTNLNKEVQDRIDDVNAEETRATNAENTLTTNLNNEITRAEGAEATLQSNIDTEKQRAEGAENTLTANLNSEITRATQAEDNEKQRAEGAEATLTTNLNSEITRATQAEETIQTNLTTEVNRATAEEAKKVDKTVTGVIAGTTTNVFNEGDGAGVDMTVGTMSSAYVDVHEDSNVAAAEILVTNNGNEAVINALPNAIYYLSNANKASYTKASAEMEIAVKKDISDLNASFTVDAGKVITAITEAAGKLTAVDTTTLTIAMVKDLQTTIDALSARIKYFEDLKLTFEDITIGE